MKNGAPSINKQCTCASVGGNRCEKKPYCTANKLVMASVDGELVQDCCQGKCLDSILVEYTNFNVKKVKENTVETFKGCSKEVNAPCANAALSNGVYEFTLGSELKKFRITNNDGAIMVGEEVS